MNDNLNLKNNLYLIARLDTQNLRALENRFLNLCRSRTTAAAV